MDASLSFAVHPCIVVPNGVQIEGSAGNLTLTTSGTSRRWWFRADTANWVREADWVTLADVIEFPDPLIAYLPYMLAIVIATEYSSTLRAEVTAGALEGREVFARTYARRGRNMLDAPIGLPQPAPAQ